MSPNDYDGSLEAEYEAMKALAKDSGERGIFHDEALKNEFSHIHDALQYLCMGVSGAEENEFIKKLVRQAANAEMPGPASAFASVMLFIKEHSALAAPPGALGKKIVEKMETGYQEIRLKDAEAYRSKINHVKVERNQLAERNGVLTEALENVQHRICQGCRENWPIDGVQEPAGKWHIQSISANAGPIYVGCSALKIKSALAESEPEAGEGK